MALLLSLIVFAILVAVIVLYGYRAYVGPARFFEQLTPRRDESGPRSEGKQAGTHAAVRFIEQIGSTVPASKEDSTEARRYLVAAGFRSEKAFTIYNGIRIASAVIFLTGALFLVPIFIDRNALRGLCYILGGFAGYYVPSLVLERMVRSRQRRLRVGMPDALDLMVIAVESGLGMDQAFISVTNELRNTHKEVTDEFALVTLEMRAGQRRIDALHNLATRTGEVEVRKLVAVLAQTDRFGTSIAEALRAHADFMRVSRRLAAEERAGKLGVKLVFPIFFFILPSMALVVAGPGLLQVIRVMMPALQNVK